jgi:hypothetical protein
VDQCPNCPKQESNVDSSLIMQYQKVAVLISGDLRYWDKAAKSIITLANSLGQQVDFFMAVWDHTINTSTTLDYNPNIQRKVTDSEIKNKFTDGQLKDYYLVPVAQTPSNSHTFYKQSYLNKVVNVLKNKHELLNDFVYDLIFEIRPDIFIFDQSVAIPTLANFEFTNTIGPAHMNRLLASGADTYCFLDSITNDVMSAKYAFKKMSINSGVGVSQEFGYGHWIIAKFRLSYMIRYIRLENFRVCILRAQNQENIESMTPSEIEELENKFYITSSAVSDRYSPHHKIVLL